MQRGFTLLEVIIYIALMGMLLAMVATAGLDLFEGSQETNGATTVQMEGSFVTRKLAWALAGATSTPTISGSGCNQSISISKAGASNPVQIRRNSQFNAIEMREGSNAFASTTTGNVSATCLQFAIVSGTPAGVSATTTISNTIFSLTKYVRE